MTALVISTSVKDKLATFLKSNPKTDLLTAYLFFLSRKLNIDPVLYIKEKMIYISEEDLLKRLEQEGKLYRETEIKIQFSKESVNENTTKIYICPFSGKVFGNNTHPSPLDAIYDWVSRCPENTERKGGLKAKKFFVSDDKEMIASYIQPRKEPIKKIVFSSIQSGKLYNSKKAAIEEFKKTGIKSIPLTDVPNQNRFQMEEHLLKFIQEQLEESKVTSFVEAVSDVEELSSFASKWLEG